MLTIDRSESTDGTSNRDWTKGEKLQNSGEITGTFNKREKSKLYLSIQHADNKVMTKSGPTWYLEYYRNYHNLHILWQKDSWTEGESATFY